MLDIFSIVNKYKDLILSAERDIWKIPETGYREVKTTAYLADGSFNPFLYFRF